MDSRKPIKSFCPLFYGWRVRVQQGLDALSCHRACDFWAGLVYAGGGWWEMDKLLTLKLLCVVYAVKWLRRH